MDEAVSPRLWGDAEAVLEEARDTAILDLYSSGFSRQREENIEESVFKLHSRLKDSSGFAPGYRKLPDLVAELVLLAWEFPEEHDVVWSSIASNWKTDTDIRTVEGLVFLRNVIELAADDHDLMIDFHDGFPSIRGQERGDTLPTLTPDSLHEAVSTLRKSLRDKFPEVPRAP